MKLFLLTRKKERSKETLALKENQKEARKNFM